MSYPVLAQTAAWTKEQRQEIFEDCMDFSKAYKLSEDQKESVCLCFLEQYTKRYTQAELENKIAIELKRLRMALLTECAKNIGANLETNTAPKEETLQTPKEAIKETPKEEPKKETPKETSPVAEKKVDINNFTAQDLYGVWKDENSLIQIWADGRYRIRWTGGKVSTGKWELQGKVLLLGSLENEILEISDGKFRYISGGNQVYNAERWLDYTEGNIEIKDKHLIGYWDCNNYTYFALLPYGLVEEHLINGKVKRGRWEMDGDVLTITVDSGFSTSCVTGVYKITSLTIDKIFYRNLRKSVLRFFKTLNATFTHDFF